MFDAMKLLGSFAQSSAAPSAGNRFGAAVNQAPQGGPLEQLMAQFSGQGGQVGGLGAMLGGLANRGGAPGQAGGLGGMLGSFAEMAKGALAQPQQEIRNNNPAAVGGLGALAGAMLGGGSGALGGGLMAVLGSLAYNAMQGQSQQGAPAAQQAAYAPAPANPADAQRRAMLMVRAMIQAAKADGQVDPQEMQRISGKLAQDGHAAEAQAWVTQEMQRPIDINGLIRDVQSPQEAAELYAASLMAIEVDSQPERDYLTDLANALRLPPAAVSQINGTMGVRI